MTAISSSPELSPDAQRELDRRRGRFVPWVIAAFYITFMSALIGFVVIAYSHPPSETTPEAYDKGLAYNDTLKRSAQMAALGWQSTIDYDSGRLTFGLQDNHHAPIEHARVKAWFVHPGDRKFDRSFDMSDTGGGVYISDAPLPAAGLWSVHVTAEVQDRQYQATTQIEVQ